MTKVVAAIIIKDGKILVAQRKKEDRLPLKWEFPGGKIRDHERPREALKREIREELGIHIVIMKDFGRNSYNYDHDHIELRAYLATVDKRESITPITHEKILWVPIERLEDLDFAPADIPFIDRLKREFHRLSLKDQHGE